MREILFRGKDDNNNWCYGYAIIGKRFKWASILPIDTIDDAPPMFDECEVKLDTVGQYTGLCDKNGTKIFEGDIVKFNKQVGYIVYEYGSFGVGIKEGINYRRLEKFTNENLDNEFEGTFNDNFIPLFEIYYNLNNVDDYIEEIEVVGNIHDNPELLEGL